MYVLLFENVDELRERRGDPNARLILYALISLQKCLLDDEGKVCLLLLVLRCAKIHKYGDKGSLSVGGKKCNYLILNALYALAHLLAKS